MSVGRHLAGILAVSLSLPGCAFLDNSGGLSGKVQDVLLFEARDDLEYIYRAAAITSALSAAATANPHVTGNHGNIRQVIGQLNGILENLDLMYKIATSSCGAFDDDGNLLVTDCDKERLYRTRFQTYTPDVDRQLVNLAAVSLSTDSFKKVVDSLESGNYATIAVASFEMMLNMMVIGNQAMGAVRQNRQEYFYTYASKDDRKPLSVSVPAGTKVNGQEQEVFSYAAAMALPLRPDAGKIDRRVFYNTYLQATLTTIQSNCLAVREKLEPDEQRVLDVKDQRFFDSSGAKRQVRDGLSINNCPNRGYFGHASAYDGRTGIFKGVGIGKQPVPVDCPKDGGAVPSSNGQAPDGPDACANRENASSSSSGPGKGTATPK